MKNGEKGGGDEIGDRRMEEGKVKNKIKVKGGEEEVKIDEKEERQRRI